MLTGNFQYFTHYDQHGLAIILFDRFSKRKRRSRVKNNNITVRECVCFVSGCVVCVCVGGGRLGMELGVC